MKYFLTIFFLVVFGFSLFSQVIDDFSDGNFTSNPAWLGDDSLFQVNNQKLQSNGPSTSSILHLSTINTLIDSTEWNFLVELAFNPSSTNFTRIYLAADQADLEGNLNGYFVQLGEAGTAPDSIDVFRQDGNVITKIFTGSSGCLTGSASAVRFKITRSSSGLWSIFADCSGGFNLKLEGFFTDNTFTTTQFFGYYCRYSTVSRFNQFFLDDLLIRNILADTIKPQVLSAVPLTCDSLRIDFNEAVNQADAENVSFYFLNNGLGNPSNAFLDSNNSSSVILVFSNPLPNAQINTLTIQNIKDVAGNQMDAAAFQVVCFVPEVNDVVINEIMADFEPQINLPLAEFIELKNNRPFPINLSGWTFSDATSTIVLPNFQIPADSFVVIVANSIVDSFAARGFNNIKVVGISSLPSLNNSGDELTLRDAQNKIIDQVVYSTSWYGDATKSNGGWTLEKRNPDTHCGAGNNWGASININGGTPGMNNSLFGTFIDTTAPDIIAVEWISFNQLEIKFNEVPDSLSATTAFNYFVNNGIGNPDSLWIEESAVFLIFNTNLDTSITYTITIQNITDCIGNITLLKNISFRFFQASFGDIVINEIMADFEPQINLPLAEFVELKNNRPFPVNLSGWTFSDATSTIVLPNFQIPADSFVVIVANSRVDSFAARGFNNIKVVGVSSLPSLNNSGDELTLRDAQNKIIDQVVYSTSWYGNAAKSNGGWTLEKRNPDTKCGAGNNWGASININGGTPGMNNSLFGTFIDTTAPRIIAVEIIDSNTILIFFSELVDTLFANNANTYNIDNGIGRPDSISFDKDKVLLFLSTNLDSAITYSLTTQNLTDCIGNQSGISTFTFQIPFLANTFDVIITEIFADPEPAFGLPIAEYIELYNASTHSISLNDWQFSDNTSTTTLGSKILLPQQYLILTSVNNIFEFQVLGETFGINNFPGLNNSGETLTLRNANGTIIHSVTYSDAWYKDNVKKAGGFSLEMIDLTNPCSGIDNWIASSAIIGGTPGQVNSVNGTNPDNSPPELNFVLMKNDTQLILTFNEPFVPSSVNRLSQFEITPNDISVVNFEVVDNLNELKLSLSSPPLLGVIYTISVSGILDCSGNEIEDRNKSDFGLAELPDSADIVINEILFNPFSFGSDFVELYNRSDKIIDLKSLIIARSERANPNDVISFANIAPGSFLFLPKTYVALTENPENILSVYFTPNPKNVLSVSNMPNYPDQNGGVILLDTFLQVIDQLVYEDSWHFALLDDKNGVSLERLNFDRTTQDEDNWMSAASTFGFATPAFKNSQFTENLEVDKTIRIEPETFSPNGDGHKDVLNIFYQLKEPGWLANIKIFDSSGRKIKDLKTSELLASEGVLNWNGINDDNELARIGIYVLWVELIRPDGKVRHIKKSFVLAGKI